MRLTRPLLLAGSFIALLTIAVLTRFPSAGAGALEPNIALLAPAGDVHVGDTFTVVAYAEHFDGVGAYELEVRFDDIDVAFISFDDGDLLGSTGRSVYCVSGPSSSTGVQYGCATAGAAPGVDGEGILAVFTFEALGVGSTNIRLPDAGLATVNGDSIDVETDNTTVSITDAATAGRGIGTRTRTVEAEPTSGTTSTAEPNKTVAVTETVEPDETETVAPTEETDETSTPVPTVTEAPATETPAAATETPAAETPTVAVQTETPEPQETVEATETPDDGETATPESTETVASGTETPEPRETPTPGEEKPTETATPDLTKPSETPESTGTPGFVPPTATPAQQTATSVATATNTVVIKTHTPAASTSTPDSDATPAATSSPGAGATAAPTQTETVEVLGITHDEPEGIVLPVTGSGGDDGPSGALYYAGILLAAGMAATMAIAAAVRRRAQ